MAASRKSQFASLKKPPTISEIKRVEQTNLLLTHWINRHKTSFVSHAIWQDNVDKVMADGVLIPSEALLRRDLKVSYEIGAGYGERGTLDIGKLVVDFKKEKFSLPKRATLVDFISLREAYNVGVISWDTYKKVTETARKNDKPKNLYITLRDGKDYKVNYFEGVDHTIEGLLYFKDESYDVTRQYFDSLKAKCEKYNCFELHVEMAAELIAENPVDNQLAKVWNSLKPLILNEDPRALARRLIQFRETRIRAAKLNDDIRAGNNVIYWTYGDVVVLKGNPDSMLSVCNKAYSDSDMNLGLQEVELKKEVSLLKPFENNGKPFTLKLSESDVIVIGPKKVLEKYQNNSHGIKIFFIEDMSKEHLKFFKVPFELQPKGKAAKKLLPFFQKAKNKIVSNALNNWYQAAVEMKKAEEVKNANDDKSIKAFRERYDKKHTNSLFKKWQLETHRRQAIARIDLDRVVEKLLESSERKSKCVVM